MATRREISLAEGDGIDVDVDDLVVAEAPKERRKPGPPVRRRGRPADSDGLTSERIVAAARACFAESGYTAASTHMVAARVGLTTGALYHHFASKRDLFMAVLAEVEEQFDERFRAVTAAEPTLFGKVEAILTETVRLTTADPTVAGFAVSVTSDVARHPDLREAFTSAWARRDTFLGHVVDAAVTSGEVAAADRKIVLDTVTTLITGLLVVGTGIPKAQVRAVEGMKRLLAGTLLGS